jgi:hypothetical protein
MRKRKEKSLKQEKHGPARISYETPLLDSWETLSPSPANHIFYEK